MMTVKINPIWNGVNSEIKEFAPPTPSQHTPLEQIYFYLRVDHFSEGIEYAVKQTGSHKNCLPCYSGKTIKCMSSS